MSKGRRVHDREARESFHLLPEQPVPAHWYVELGISEVCCF